MVHEQLRMNESKQLASTSQLQLTQASILNTVNNVVRIDKLRKGSAAIGRRSTALLAVFEGLAPEPERVEPDEPEWLDV